MGYRLLRLAPVHPNKSVAGLSAISTVAAASFFHVRLERVAFGANVTFGAAVAVLGTAILSLLNAVLAG